MTVSILQPGISQVKISYAIGRVSIMVVLWLYGITTSADYFPVLLTFPTFLLILHQTQKIKASQFTPADMLWLCSLMYFVVAPIQNIQNYGFITGAVKNIKYEIGNFLMAELIVFISLLAFSFGIKKSLVQSSQAKPALFATKRQLILIFIVSLFGFFLYINFAGGISNVILPRELKSRQEVSFLSVAFLAVLTLGTTLLALALNIQIKQKINGRIVTGFLFIFAALLLLFCINPINSPRFFNIATWIPVLFALFGGNIKYSRIYLVLLVGAILVMPLMSITTRGGFEALSNYSETVYAENPWLLKDIDVFDTLVHMASIITIDNLYFGSNSAAILLFFIPRSIWIGKPVVGGLIIGGDLQNNYFAGTDNLSLFPGGDFYMDFWLPGVLCGSFIAGIFVKKLMRLSLSNLRGNNLTALVLIGSLPILLRGPLGAVIGYFTCLIFACIFYHFLINSRLHTRKLH